LSIYETPGRRNVRWLSDGEFEELRRFTSRQEVEDLGPESYVDRDERAMVAVEYLRLTKGGGRRIAFDALARVPRTPSLHEELSGLFYRLSKSGEFMARYDIEDSVPGVEVLFADKKRSVEMVCGEGGRILALITGKPFDGERIDAEVTQEWRDISSGFPGKVADAPPQCQIPIEVSRLPKALQTMFMNSIAGARLSTGSWFYAGGGADLGIWKLSPEMEPVKIVGGGFSDPIVTPDEKWLVALKFLTEAGDYTPRVIRYNMQTGKEFTVKLPQNESSAPSVYLAAQGKILLGPVGDYGELRLGGRNYLLDPETGAVQPLKGEFRPLARGRRQSPQPTGRPYEFWAAIYDAQKDVTRFGRYDSKTFSFTPLLDLPNLQLASDDLWVEAAAGKLWITYQGQLLRMPLPAGSN
jgi:hypothetical protein